MFSDGGKGAESSGWSDGNRYELSCVSHGSTERALKGFDFILMQFHLVLVSASFDQKC